MIWKTDSIEIMGLDYQLDRKSEKGITGMTTFYLGKEQMVVPLVRRHYRKMKI